MAEEDGGGWECVRCGEAVKSAERCSVDFVIDASGSEYEISSDLDTDTTDFSGSMVSRSELA